MLLSGSKKYDISNGAFENLTSVLIKIQMHFCEFMPLSGSKNYDIRNGAFDKLNKR